MTPDQIKEEARFAQLVSTPNGPGILIAGHVFEVRVPVKLNSSLAVCGPYGPDEYAAALVAAMRHGSQNAGEAS